MSIRVLIALVLFVAIVSVLVRRTAAILYSVQCKWLRCGGNVLCVCSRNKSFYERNAIASQLIIPRLNLKEETLLKQ